MTEHVEAEKANSIEEILEIEAPREKISVPAVIDVVPKTAVVKEEAEDTENPDLIEDYEDTREKLKSLYNEGSGALSNLVLIAEQTESPRAYEVVAQLLRNLSEISEKLLDAHQKTENVKRTKEGSKPQQTGPNVHNQILFTGTTDELQTLLEDMSKRHGEND